MSVKLLDLSKGFGLKRPEVRRRPSVGFANVGSGINQAAASLQAKQPGIGNRAVGVTRNFGKAGIKANKVAVVGGV